MAGKEFRDQIKVEKVEQDDAKKIIRELNQSMQVYYPENNKADLRTQALRSGENVYLTFMMLARILFSINKESEGLVDARITMRSKAQDSQNNKEDRPDRKKRKEDGENVDLRDILACTIIIDRVHCSEDFNRVFNDVKIQGLYNERKLNLQLMEVATQFIIKMIRNVDLPSDLYHKELTKEERKEILRQCNDVLDNIEEYYFEENNGNDSTDKAKKNEKKLRIDQYIIDMCSWLQDQKIAQKKEKLEQTIKELRVQIKEEQNSEKKAKLQAKQKELMEVLENIKELESKNKKVAIVKEFESVFFEDEDLNLYTEIKKYLEEQKWTTTNYENKEISNEQIISQLSIVTLYSLLKLQFQNPNAEYQGKAFDKLFADLTNELRAYKYYEIDKDEKGKKHKYNNMTYTDVNNLLQSVIFLNSSLSDKLQYEIIKYQMENYLILEFVQRVLGEEGYSTEEKNKTNGYFAIHYDFDNFELKVTTDYRDKVMTRGTAAYANRKK